MEITILSAQDLKNTSSILLSNRLRPYATIATYPPPTTAADDKQCHGVYKTRVDNQGGANPTWEDDKFYLHVDNNSFFANGYSCIFLQIYTDRFILGRTLLGWCQIPVSDIIGYPIPPPSPAVMVRNLSYRLRDRDGSRGKGVVNIAIKLGQYSVPVVTGERHRQSLPQPLPLDTCHVIGIPVTACPCMKDNVNCKSRIKMSTCGRDVGIDVINISY